MLSVRVGRMLCVAVGVTTTWETNVDTCSFIAAVRCEAVLAIVGTAIAALA
jgi:hypothetical protein